MTRRPLPGALSIAVITVISTGASAPAQQSPVATFRAETNYVEVDARVLDRDGGFVRGIRQDDFEILEDGRPEKIDTFALVDIPFEAPAGASVAGRLVEPDVASNADSRDGRVYLLVLDNIHVSSEGALHVRRIARSFVEAKLAANDRASVIAVRGDSAQSRTFTDDRRLLLAAIDRFAPAPWVGTGQEPTLAALRSLQAAAEFLGSVHGRRKALMFFSQGSPMPLQDFQLYARDTLAPATRNNVSIYTIDPSGLDAPEVDASTPPSSEPITQSGQRGQTSVDLRQGIKIDSSRYPQWNLRTLAEESGGFAVSNTNNFDGAFDRIVAENSAYYLLGYRPSRDRREGQRRRIEVRVRRPGVQVVARQSYIEPRGDLPSASPAPAGGSGTDPLATVMSAPLPTSGLRLTTTAAAFKGGADPASVVVVAELNGRDLRFTEVDGKFTGTLHLWAGAVDGAGRLATGRQDRLDFGLTREELANITTTGLRVVFRLNVRPGQYQIRVGGRLEGTESIGTTFYDLDVPDFAQGRLGMSGVVLASREADDVPTVRGDAQLAAVLPGAPTAQRVFASDDALTIFAEVYDSTPGGGVIEIATRILDEQGRAVFNEVKERSTADGTPQGSPGYRVAKALGTFGPGRYALEIEARSAVDPREFTRRVVPFRIRE